MKPFISKVRSYINRYRMFTLATLVLSGVLVAGVVSASTTITTDINTGGQLTVTGTSTLIGVVSVGSSTPASNAMFQVGTRSPNLFVDKNTGNVGIGTTSPVAKLNVVGATSTQLMLSYDASHQVGIGSDSNGDLVLSTTASGTNFVSTTYLNGYPFIQQSDDVVGSYQLAVGKNSQLASFNTKDNSSGDTSFGIGSLQNATSSYFLTAFGAFALQSLGKDGFVTAVGYCAACNLFGGDHNTVIGTKTLYTATSTSDNVAVGEESLKYMTSSVGGNTAVGRTSGYTVTTGTNDTFLGNRADVGSGAISNSTAIGAYAVVTASNSIVLGSGAVNVGINTTAPLAPLQVVATTTNATTTVIIGKAGQNKGSCLQLYDAAGTAVYAYVAAGASTFTLSATSCKLKSV
jgi:hypothetical protein